MNGGHDERKTIRKDSLDHRSQCRDWLGKCKVAGEGANLVITARRQERMAELESAAQTAGGKAVSLLGDAKEEDTARRAVDLAVQTFGSLDILINNVGIGNYKNLVERSAEDYDEMMDTNMRSRSYSRVMLCRS